MDKIDPQDDFYNASKDFNLWQNHSIWSTFAIGKAPEEAKVSKCLGKSNKH